MVYDRVSDGDKFSYKNFGLGLNILYLVQETFLKES